jgi:lysozyme
MAVKANKSSKRKRSKRKRKKHSRNWLFLMIASGVVGVLILAAGLFYVNKRLHHPNVTINSTNFPIRGIDVSSHNGVINFARVARDSVSFVILKASEGTSFKDPRFDLNYSNATKAGLRVGAYHFFRKSNDGRLQADNFMRSVQGKRLDLPFVIDIEDWGNDHFVSHSSVMQNFKDMYNRLDQYGVRIMIYTNKNGYDKYVANRFRDASLWICTFDEPGSYSNYDWRIQQYSHWGNIDGITGDVDLNVFNGNAEQWEAWVQDQ